MSIFRSWDYPSCSDWERHQDEAREDARRHSHYHEPSMLDNRDCQSAYEDAYKEEQRKQERLQEEREAEERHAAYCEERRRQDYLEEQRREELSFQQQSEEPQPEEPIP